jgi:hypothetical protein
MEFLNSKKIQSFVKWSMLELATNIKIDHRNYSNCDKKQPSLLVEKIKKNDNNFELGIDELSNEIIVNEKIINMCIELDMYNKITDDDELVEDKLDLIEESETELFSEIIRLIGLFEIPSLHGDYYDKFQKKFYKILYDK